ncbi:N-acetyltransferase 9 [Physocladia obscura]|uniref:N-acetyltransferase 9 n=1 Tax=Physocladia obscura TaxID=109957 RepID=A0AAD5T3V2_9FUNG|nr:N-acetyltransferase 9 [Physocladia obscura]
MTASEPLSLAEEYEMQQSWAVDETKLTFIVLSPFMRPSESSNNISLKDDLLLRIGGGMVGDVNLYFTDFEDPMGRPEIEVMIAEPSMRRKGIALEALQLLMHYAVTNIPSIHTFVAKISLKNNASRALFTKKLGFVQVSISEVFGEVTLEKKVSAAAFNEFAPLKILLLS